MSDISLIADHYILNGIMTLLNDLQYLQISKYGALNRQIIIG